MAAIALSIFLFVLFIVFIQSGAKGGVTTLNVPAAYAPGSIQYISEENFYLARLNDGTFLALSDLDAANRANTQHRCRVAAVGADDPALPALVQQYASRMSPQAAGSTYLLKEDCNDAIYDFTGARLNGDGPNLDRLEVGTGNGGKLEVNTTRRTCTQRSGTNVFAPIACN